MAHQKYSVHNICLC